MINIKYPFEKQEEAKDCGAACLSMIIRYYNGYLSMEKIRNLLKTDKNGTTAYHLIEGAKKIGFTANGVKCDFDEINEDNIVLPCIANVIINNVYKHFIVIYKIDYKNKLITIADPSSKIVKMTFDIFKSIFSGVLVILYPNDNIPFEAKSNFLIHLYKNSHPKLIMQICILSLFITVLSIFSSFYLKILTQTLSSNYINFIKLICILFFIINTLKVLTLFFKEKIVILIDEKISLKYTLDTYKKILSLPYKNYRDKTTGDILTRLLDINTMKDNMTKIFLTVIVDIPLGLLSMIVLYLMNSKLFFISLIILLLYSLSYFLFKDLFDNSIEEIKKGNIDTTNYIIESINNFETVKGLSIYDQINNKFERKYVNYLKKVFNYKNMYTLQNFLKNFISEIGLVVIYGIGAAMVANKKMDFGTLLTFGALLSYFIEPIKNVISLESNYRELKIVTKRINELYEYEDIEKEERIMKGDIEIKGLNFTYNDKYEILKDVSLSIKSGEKIVVLGSSGSGKSTLFKLLMKYYEVSRNQIFINSIDINDYRFPNGILYVSQVENLFTDTFYNNICLNRDINIRKFDETVKLCCVDDIIKSNDLGYNTLIEDNGFNISGGEKQRIVLARSILDKFNILIIDEGFSQIDVNLERKILKNLFTKFPNKTIIVISHRKENIDLYNRMIKLEMGRIISDTAKV